MNDWLFSSNKEKNALMQSCLVGMRVFLGRRFRSKFSILYSVEINAHAVLTLVPHTCELIAYLRLESETAMIAFEILATSYGPVAIFVHRTFRIIIYPANSLSAQIRPVRASDIQKSSFNEFHFKLNKISFEPETGFEPATCALRMRCSTS